MRENSILRSRNNRDAIRVIFNSLKKKNGEEKLLNSSRLVFYDNVCKKGSERGKKIRRS